MVWAERQLIPTANPGDYPAPDPDNAGGGNIKLLFLCLYRKSVEVFYILRLIIACIINIFLESN